MRQVFFFLLAVLILRLFFPDIASGLEEAVVSALALFNSVANRASAGPISF